jgi:hypothetical protein
VKNLPPGPAAVFFALLLAVTLPLAAQVELEPHGMVETFHAVPFSSDRNLTDSRTAFTGEISAFAGEASAFLSLSAEYNAVSSGRTGFSLGEAWLDWGGGGFSLRLGRQLLSWGVADGLIFTDVVCPQNLGAYAGLDFAGSRLPVDGLRLRYSFTALTLEGVWLPLFTPARLPRRGDPLRTLLSTGMFPMAPSKCLRTLYCCTIRGPTRSYALRNRKISSIRSLWWRRRKNSGPTRKEAGRFLFPPLLPIF